MKFDSTIGRAGFWGMAAVSWLSILLIGGAWIWATVDQFAANSERIRTEHFARQRALVESEVHRAMQMVEDVRRTNLVARREDVSQRCEAAVLLGETLTEQGGRGMTADKVRRLVLNAMRSKAFGDFEMYDVSGETVFLISPLPEKVDRLRLLIEMVQVLEGVSSGQRQFSLPDPFTGERLTYFVTVMESDKASMRVVSGACLESIESEAKKEVLRRLRFVQFGRGDQLFGGTWKGVSILGPAKGRSMWGVSDTNGVMIVQELIKAAQRGGGFVHYVMPPISGRAHSKKISYAAGIPDWQWYVGAGTYVDDIEAVIERNRQYLKTHIYYEASIILCGLAFLSVLALSLSFRLSRKLKMNIQSFLDVWELASTKGMEIDVRALHYNEFRQLASAANAMAHSRQEAQEAQMRSVERLSSLVSSIPGIVYHCHFDTVWTMEFISDYVLEVAGYPAADFVRNAKRTFVSLVHPDDRAWVEKAVAESMKRRRPFVVEYRIVRADGEVRWLSERGRAVFDDHGEPMWLDGVIFDVTDRKDAEQEYYNHLHFLETMERVDRSMQKARDLESMLSDVLETIRGAFGADRSWLLFPCDPDVETFRVPMERSAPEYPGAMERDMEVPMEGEIRDVVVRSLENPGPQAYCPGGLKVPPHLTEIFGVQSQLVMAIHVNVGPPWLMGFHQCRDARVWTKEESDLFREAGRRVADGLNNLLMLRELKESEEKFRTFFEQAMLGLCVVQDNQVIFVNQAYADIFETTTEAMLALPPSGFIKYVHPDDRQFLMEQAIKKQAGEDGAVPVYTWRAVTETGRLRWVEIHSRTAMVNGRTADLISLTDITEQMQAEEDLEGVIAERLGDISARADELRQANAHLIKMDEVKTAFLATVSDDLRAPLTSALGFARLVRQDLEKMADSDGETHIRREQIASNLDVMEAEGRRLTRLIDNFMELTALEAGAASWNDVPLSVEQSISRAVKHAEYRLKEKPEVSLAFELDGELPEMSMDAERFEKMLGNLIDNAIIYTDEGTISVRAHSPDGVGLELAVADTGRGIPEGDLETIFDAFYRVETVEALGDSPKGAGLGLALSRLVARHYGGEIRAESALDEGSVFHVSLPGAGHD